MMTAPRRSGPRESAPWRAGLWACLILACAPAASSGQEGGPEPKPPASVASDPQIFTRVRSLMDELRGDSPRSPEETVERLAGFGPAIAPYLLSVRNEFRDAVHVSVIADALAQLKSDKLEGYLVWIAGGSPSVPSRVVAWVKLREHGGLFALPHVMRLMATNDPREKRVAERALSAILARHEDAGAYGIVSRFLHQAGKSVQTRILSCVADAGSVLGLPVLADRIGIDGDLDLVIVSGIARLPVKAKDEAIVSKLVSLLASKSGNLRRECALALGVFKVADSVRTLIDLLQDGDRGVRSNAHWSLRSISDLDLPPDPHAWRIWFEREQEWWTNEGQRFVKLLGTGGEGQVLNAIAMLAVRPLFRQKIAPHLEALLDSDSERVREAARRALAGARTGFGGGGGGAGRTALEGGRLVRQTADPVEPLEEADDLDLSVSWVVYVILGVFILLFALYVFGALHPDRILSWFRRAPGSP